MVLTAVLVVGAVVFVRSRPKAPPVDRTAACPLLDKKEVAKVTRRKVHSIEPDTGPLEKRLCVVSFVGTDILKLYVSRDGGRAVYLNAASSNIPGDATDITGVGDEARWLRGAQVMVVRSGLDTFTFVTLGLAGTEEEHQAIARQLAPTVIERLRKTPPSSTKTTAKN